MIETLAAWFVQRPLHIAAVAAFHALAWLAFRATVLRGDPRSNRVGIAALVWLAFAGWEAWVYAKTPEANIRVDLLLIGPVVILATVWAWVRTLRGVFRAQRSRPS